jgi:hypothetical protein
MKAKAKPSKNGHVNRIAAVPSTPSANGSAVEGKDPATGQFVAGNKCGKGNPRYRQFAANRVAFLEAVTPEQVTKLARKLMRRALDGDLDAAKLVLAYAIGKPAAVVDPDGADRAEWQQLEDSPHSADVFAQLGKVVFADALRMIQNMQPFPIKLVPDEPAKE